MTFDNYIHIALDIKVIRILKKKQPLYIDIFSIKEVYNLFDGFVSKLIINYLNKIK